MTGRFDCFVGIDWSGAAGRWQKGLKVAVCRPGRDAPYLEPGSGHRKRWSRAEVVDWITNLVGRERALIGLDFAFGFPVMDVLAPAVRLDWDYVQDVCGSAGNFYGGAFFRVAGAPHSHLVNSPWLPKRNYSADNLRKTDMVASQMRGARPQSIFNAVGPAQVGPSSISGMRALRHLVKTAPNRMVIWPFDQPREDSSVIVEIFPRYYTLCRLAGLSAHLADHVKLNSALSEYDSDPVKEPPESEDEGDAILSAAALRSLSADPSLFELPDPSIRMQGWIFGVPLESGKTS